jgi:hypothetical protein
VSIESRALRRRSPASADGGPGPCRESLSYPTTGPRGDDSPGSARRLRTPSRLARSRYAGGSERPGDPSPGSCLRQLPPRRELGTGSGRLTTTSRSTTGRHGAGFPLQARLSSDPGIAPASGEADTFGRDLPRGAGSRRWHEAADQVTAAWCRARAGYRTNPRPRWRGSCGGAERGAPRQRTAPRGTPARTRRPAPDRRPGRRG